VLLLTIMCLGDGTKRAWIRKWQWTDVYVLVT
jgi:hypothetical protein